MTEPVLVLGIGNILNTDEGVGVHALRALQDRYGEPPDIFFADGGTLGLDLLPLIEDKPYLLLLDAVDAGEAPGTVIELAKDEIPLYGGYRLSQHQVTFTEVLGLALIRGHLPEHLHLIGVQPDSLEIGVGMSEIVTAAIPDVLARAEAKLAEWGLTLVRSQG